MTIKDLKNSMKGLTKFFVDYEGRIHKTDGLHEQLARDICEEYGWDWRSKSYYSCADYLLAEKGFIKFSNYVPLKYVAISKRFKDDKKVLNNAYYLADLFNLRVEIY